MEGGGVRGAHEVFEGMLLVLGGTETWGRQARRRGVDRGSEAARRDKQETKPACVRASKLKSEVLWGPLPAVPDRFHVGPSHGLGAAPLQCGPCPTGGKAAGVAGTAGPPVCDHGAEGCVESAALGFTGLWARLVSSRAGVGFAGSIVGSDRPRNVRFVHPLLVLIGQIASFLSS